MLKMLEILNTIKDALGDDDCQVMAVTNNHGGFTIRVQWKDEKFYDRLYTADEFNETANHESLIYRFIGWAQECRLSHDLHINQDGKKG